MDRLRKLRILRTFVIALYALAVASVGLAHQAMSIAPPSPDLSAFVLPDGTMPDLCANADDPAGAGGLPQGAAAAVCDACLLTAAPGTTPAAGCWLPARQAAAGMVSPAPYSRHVLPAAHHVPHLRGPPAAA